MASTQSRLPRRLFSLLLVATLVGAGGISMVSVAAQAAPINVQTLPAAEFNAPKCVGGTNLEPTAATGPVADLTRVFGQRLTDFNNGQAVVLYGSWGVNDNDAYPALCGTRFVDGVGAVSEWMFCTDIWSHVCSGTDASGNLVDKDGVVIPGLDPKIGNPKLTTNQEKLIAYLIQNGHLYQGTGYYNFDGTLNTVVTQSAGTYARYALQALVWCISDPVDLNRPGMSAATLVSEQQRLATCEASINAAEQARLLALIPDAPTVQLDFADSGSSLKVGDTASFALTTNLYNQPIELSATGVAGNLKVITGDAVITGTTLTVQGTDPSKSTTIALGFTASTAGTVTARAAALPASTTHIGWNKSPGLASDGKPCQNFATFNKTEQLAVNAMANAIFNAAATQSASASASATDSATATATTLALTSETHSDTATKSAASGEAIKASSASGGTMLAQTGSSTAIFAFGALLVVGLGVVLVSARRLGRKH